MKIDKNKLKTAKGNYIVQGLFLEDTYNTDLAVFTYSGDHKEYKGKEYPSLKKLYLEMADPVEYTFANTYLFDWPHWQRMCNNALVSKHIDQWREELALKLASEGVLTMIDLATQKDSYQAAKYLADHGWDTKKRGRPSKEEVESEIRKRADEKSEWDEDNGRVLRLMEANK